MHTSYLPIVYAWLSLLDEFAILQYYYHHTLYDDEF